MSKLKRYKEEMQKKNNRIYIYLPLILACVLIIGMFLGTKLFTVSSQADKKVFNFSSERYNKIGDVLNFIVQDYVDSVSGEKLKEDAIIGMLNDLDPHSQYISADEFQEMKEPLLGNFEGIGVEFRIVKDTITVMHIIPGGPSEKIGILAGDRIVNIDDSLVAGIGITNKETIGKLKGERETKVNVDIWRPSLKEMIQFTITRDIIPLYSIDISYMVNDSVGYIKLSKFSATTPAEFEKALKELMNQGMEKMILDLRGNVGGYLKSAISLADEFLVNNQLIVYTEGKNRPRQFAYASKRGKFEKGEVIVLIDEGSASASEIIAGAIQDNDRGIIIGRRSYGKGLVQEELELLDGSAIRLTVARYHTPTGRCIQKSYEEGREEYHKEFYERFTNGEMQNPDSIRFPDSLKYYTKNGKIVYGGGGIMPDIYIPVKSGTEYVFFNKLVNKGLIYQYAFDYYDTRRKEMHEKYKTLDKYVTEFQISDIMFNDFMDFAENKDVEKDHIGIETSGLKIRNLMKAYIGRNIYNNAGFYPVFNEKDPVFIRAVEEFTKN